MFFKARNSARDCPCSRSQGFTIRAIHNHFVRNNPNVMYMHIGGMGDEAALATKVKAVFDKVKKVRGRNPVEKSSYKVEN